MPSDVRTRLESALSGQYAIERELGGGGMAQVFLAKDNALGRRVVIKVLSAELTASVSVKRFEREIRLAAALQQANIVPVLSAGDADGTPYYTMPFVEGLSLRDRLELQGRPALPETISILRDVARALAYAHERGVVHRDIKPDNILLSGGTAAVADFGIAKALANAALPSRGGKPTASTVTHAGTAVGTPDYMAPEQIAGDPDVDHRVDLYSFGCLGYELLAGKAPFGGRATRDLFTAHLSERPTSVAELAPECPPALARLVMRCLEKDPVDRPASAQDILATLDTVTTAATPFERFRQRFTRRQRMGALALVALVVVAAAAAFGLRGRVAGGVEPIQSLAVLPIENLSGNPDQDYFANGLHEALILDLSRLSGLRRVINRKSVARFATGDTPLKEIARELGVEALITATVQQSGDSVRVTAHLIRASNEEPIWSDQYTRAERDRFSLQDEIVAAITREINLKLTPQEQTRLATAKSVNPEAREAYLKGKFYLSFNPNPQGLETAMRYFESALKTDSNYAPAHAGIGTVWHFQGNMLYVPFREAQARAKSAALKAIALDDQLAEGHDLLGRILGWIEWDWKAAEEQHLRAIELNPGNADARVSYSILLMTQGRIQDAQRHVAKAIELDPLNSGHRIAQAYQLGQMRRYDDAIAMARGTLGTPESDGEFEHWIMWRAYHQKRMYPEALAEARIIFASDSIVLAALSHGFAAGGYAEANRQAAEKLAPRKTKDFGQRENVAILYAFAGKKALALDWLEKGFETHHAMMSFIGIDPHWDVLRAEPRFRELMRKINLPESLLSLRGS